MRYITVLVVSWVVWAGLAKSGWAAEREWPTPWVGVHVLIDGRENLEQLKRSIPELGKMGVNALVIEVAYNYDFKSHPELASGDPVTRQQAREVADLCRKHGIRPIPEINLLGHQSWAEKTHALLTQYPELDETPGQYPGNRAPEGDVKFYCRSYCPLHPKTLEVVLPLVDEVIAGFDADAFHVGMDEVFLIASEHCPRCRGKDPAEVYARHVNDLHDHLVKRKKVEMFIWGDRLLDAKQLGYSRWEASANGTAPAVDRIPKDIVVCDWHYEKQAEYKSIPFLLGKGFRVWPSSWKDPEATKALIDASMKEKDPRMVGHLSTTWYQVKPDQLHTFPPTKVAAERFGGK